MSKDAGLVLVWIVTIFLNSCSCQGQNSETRTSSKDRFPCVAGSFYPADKNELANSLRNFFNEATLESEGNPLAIIVPHAGYVFSGSVAAAAYKQIDRDKLFDHIFIIGSSHTMYFDGVSIFSGSNFITPMGKVKVDTLATLLDQKFDFISCESQPHEKEHSIEVQLPFLQYWLKKPFSVVPIIIGGNSQRICRYLADALKPYLNEKNLFIISSDFSHYPSYSSAITSDNTMADAILSNSPKIFMQTKIQTESRGISELATAMCGWTSALTLLNMTESRNDVKYQKVLYKNSGDSQYGDKDRVVGYNAICLFKTEKMENQDQFSLSEEDKVELLKLARKTISDYINLKKINSIDESRLSKTLLTNAGAFVTLKSHGNLRGCIGNFSTDIPLYKVVQSMAIAASTQDYRFEPVTSKEISELEIEISVLTPMKKIKSIDEIILGKHGIYIKKENFSGTFLPQVATGTGWSKEEFLGHCARDKAFIGWDGWKTADIYTYEALVFEEKEFRNELK